MADVKKIATRDSYGNALKDLGASATDLVVLDADLAGATKTVTFQKTFPERHFDCGIAEANMMDVAAGLSTMGLVPFASTFAMFAAGRAYEQVRNTIGYPHLNVKIGATHGGISVGEDGASHQCCEDFALMRSIPVYHNEDFKLEIGKGELLRDGNDVAIIATGIMVPEAIEAGKALATEGISACIINMPTIKPLDAEMVLKAARECGKIVTVEEHSIIGGLGEAVCSLTSENCPVPVKRIGVNDEFGHSGPFAALLKAFGLCAENIVLQTKRLLKK